MPFPNPKIYKKAERFSPPILQNILLEKSARRLPSRKSILKAERPEPLVGFRLCRNYFRTSVHPQKCVRKSILPHVLMPTTASFDRNSFFSSAFTRPTRAKLLRSLLSSWFFPILQQVLKDRMFLFNFRTYIK